MSRHLADPVDRLARALTLLFAAAAAFAAWRGSQPHPTPLAAPDATLLFERHCAGCHDRAELQATLAAKGEPDVAALIEFLATHGRSDAAADRTLASDLLPTATR